MDIWQTLNGVFLVILGSIGCFVLCCMWFICEEMVKGWRKKRGEKDG